VNFGLPLCLVLMDGSETNFSGWRGAVDEARKGFVADQMNLVRRLHKPAYTWWLHREIELDSTLKRVAKLQKINIFGHKWNLPTWSYIEPVADSEGDASQIRNGQTSPRRMQAARGKDHETIVDETIEDNAYAITKAQARADEINAKFPKATPLTWRDLVPMPMPEGQTIALQDPAAVAVQADAAKTTPVKKPVARRKKPTAAGGGRWVSTEDGGKIFIGDDGDTKFGGPDGPPVKEGSGSTKKHNIALPKTKTRLTIDQSRDALKQMGYTQNTSSSKYDFKTKETTYEITKPDGTTERMSGKDIRKLVYDGAGK
ncbi:MAG TPA: hypothetical protein PK992_10745, partial [Planctomycetaceae bacterium]|nr:hypothetical protein [Planctomycetaceae bacterium]